MDNRKKLISIRKELGLTQKQMASSMGISEPGYKKLEQGQRPIKDIHIKVAECLYK